MPDEEHEHRRRRFPHLGRRDEPEPEPAVQDERPERPRLIGPGDAYTAEELARGEVELQEVPPIADPPPEETRGEVWGSGKWDRDLHPRGWREDGEYPGQRNRDEPGPYDGAWEPPAGQEGRDDGA
jgi:hypothetical protein